MRRADPLEKTANGKAMPLDVEPVANGNLGFRDDGRVILLSGLTNVAWDAPRYVSHFATCPDATTYRKPR